MGLVSNPHNKSNGWDRPILCDDKVHQYGDAIAIVCADTGPTPYGGGERESGAEELPAYMSAPAAMAPDALEIHPGTPNVYFTMKNIKGADTKPIMAGAPYVVEDEFYTQRRPTCP